MQKSINIIEALSKDDVWMNVKTNSNYVILAISIRKDGDIQVCLNPEDAKALSSMLTEAATAALLPE